MALSQRVVRTEDKRGERVSPSGRRETTTMTMTVAAVVADIDTANGDDQR